MKGFKIPLARLEGDRTVEGHALSRAETAELDTAVLRHRLENDPELDSATASELDKAIAHGEADIKRYEIEDAEAKGGCPIDYTRKTPYDSDR